MAERPIDTHETRRTRNFAVNKVSKWLDAWIACYHVVEDSTSPNLKSFHQIFERWVPILNWIFEKPIFDLEAYDPKFYYCHEPNGPKEIIQLYFEENPSVQITTIHVIFNLYEFNMIHKKFCVELSRSNQLLVNEGRGTIDLSSAMEHQQDSAQYFQTMMSWQLLFIYTLHAMAHFDIYNKYRHAHYDTHQYMRDSPFYKFYCCGEMMIRK